VPPKAPIPADLTWLGDLKFAVTVNDHSLTIDSASKAGPSPVEALVVSLAGCMSIDVAHILTRGRHPFTAIRSHIVAERAPEDPHRLTRVHLHMKVEGGAPRDVVDRAVALSHDKYCSVWHSMRQDIDFQISADVA